MASNRAKAIGAACALSVSLTAAYEGLRTHPYPDPGDHRTLTVCYGETERPMRVYTPEECQVLLEARQQNDYAPAVLKCVPGLADRRDAFAASIDGAYNAGVYAFCRSPMAAHFRAGDWAGGCKAFSNWRVTAHGRLLRGLVRRRAAERSLCEKGLT